MTAKQVKADRDARAGRFLRGEYVAVGFSPVPAESDGIFLADLPKDSLFLAFNEAYAKEGPAVANANARIFWRFVHDVNEGDLFFLRDYVNNLAWCGEVGGPHRLALNEKAETYQHQLPATWIAALPLDDRGVKDAVRPYNGCNPVVAPEIRAKLQRLFGLSEDYLAGGAANQERVQETRRVLARTYLTAHGSEKAGRVAQFARTDYTASEVQVQASTQAATAKGHNEHNEARNDLLAWLRRELGPDNIREPRSTSERPAFDLLVDLPDDRSVIEVKSLNDANEEEQLRLGVGQVLDYRSQMHRAGRAATAVLWVSRMPSEAERWRDLCAEVGVRLGWPGEERKIFWLR
ncbi:hypothetical protein ACFV4F_37645 [Kitasatospora sp. NPDC059722]|uniref:hypothetical protein n=1 Tax=Kitasatospora sp. NPDC059722 TaxID=3346925 RepID=UPI0036C27FE1